MKTMAAMLSLLIVLLFHVPLPFPAPAAAATTGLRAALTRIDSGSPFTFTERFNRAVRRSRRRRQVLKLTKGPIDVEATVEWGDFEYMVSLAVGTPPLPITAILDTGSDLIWTQCIPCFECLPQLGPYYDPSNSSTFAMLPCPSPSCAGVHNRCTLNLCQYETAYGDGTVTMGFLATETFTFDGSPVAGVTFGCGMANDGTLSNSTGIVGMARGRLSLPSQLHPKKFAYCLTPFNSSSSSHLFLGSMAELNPLGGGVPQSTPMVPSPSSSSFYYLSLHGISLGHTLLPIPDSAFQLKADGSGGMIIDSGSFLTMLDPVAYDAVRKEILSLVHLPVANSTEEEGSSGYQLCFSLAASGSGWQPPPEMPDMIFHFDGGNMVFPRDKYMSANTDEAGSFCLTIVGENGTSILGNYQQQNMHFVYDLEANVLSFAPAQCDQL